MGDRVVTVAEGRIRWGYHLAGTLRGCRVTRTDGVWSLQATIVSVDAFRLTQQPLTLEVRHQKGMWTWPVHGLQVAGGTLTASLGPPGT